MEFDSSIDGELNDTCSGMNFRGDQMFLNKIISSESNPGTDEADSLAVPNSQRGT